MDKKVHKIVSELKSKIAFKYKLKELKVFGSTARGERRDDSDIDVYILISEVNRKLEEELFDIAYDLELKYDCLIDLIVFDEHTLNEKYVSTPFYQNVSNEGLNV
jgi:predicted nucleotidyltransferase